LKSARISRWVCVRSDVDMGEVLPAYWWPWAMVIRVTALSALPFARALP
jgi:hypothetical protein